MLTDSDPDYIKLIQLIGMNKVKEVEELLQKNSNIIYIKDSITKFTPLIFAVVKGYKDMVTLLISCGANIYAQDHGGGNCLHWAFSEVDNEKIAPSKRKEYFEIVEILLAHERQLHFRYSLQAISTTISDEEMAYETFYLIRDNATGEWSVKWKEQCGKGNYETYNIPVTNVEGLIGLLNDKTAESFVKQENSGLRESICQKLRLHSILLTTPKFHLPDFMPFSRVENPQIKQELETLIHNLLAGPIESAKVIVPPQFVGLHPRQLSDRKDSYGGGPSSSDASCSASSSQPSPSEPASAQSSIITKIAGGVLGFFGVSFGGGYRKLPQQPQQASEKPKAK